MFLRRHNYTHGTPIKNSHIIYIYVCMRSIMESYMLGLLTAFRGICLGFS